MPIMKRFLLIAFFFPAAGFSQKFFPKVEVGAGYSFFSGSANYGNINGDYAKNGLKNGFVAEAAVTQQLNGFLHVGLGASLLKFNHTNPYIPLYAEVKVIGPGRYKLFSFLRPGYGFYKGSYNNSITGLTPSTASQKGGFYISYGAGVMLKICYLQATYHWLRFNTTNLGEHSSAGYGEAALTFGVRLP